MEGLDRLACAVTDTFVAEVKSLYQQFFIHDAYLRVVEFESAMSSFYFDALKDPLYSLGANSTRRRSAQSALLYIVKRFLTALAPMLSFTAEEAWQEIPAALRKDAFSVFDSSFGAAPRAKEDELELWEALRGVRARVAASEIRDFEAQAALTVPARLYELLRPLGDNLREALVVSQVELRSGEGSEIELVITNAAGQKCRRCWKFRELGSDPGHPSICADCAVVVEAL
jgi:isoleucyl-tRNA synthetase